MQGAGMGGYYLQLAWRRCRQNLPMVGLLVLTLAVGIAACMTAFAQLLSGGRCVLVGAGASRRACGGHAQALMSGSPRH